MRKQFAGNAVPATLVGTIGTTDLTFTTDTAEGWPDGSIGPFVGIFDKGLPTVEKVLFSSRSGTTWTVSQRGYDGTVPSSHTNSKLRHVIDADTVNEANLHANSPHPATQFDPGLVGRAAADYPVGLSYGTVLVEDGWPATGTVFTNNRSEFRFHQEFVAWDGSFREWRTHHPNYGFSAWKRTPNPGEFQQRQVIEATLPVGWHRFARNGSVAGGATDGNRASALFHIVDTRGSYHSSTFISAMSTYGEAPTLTLLGRSTYMYNGAVQHVRLVEGGTYEGAAVEIYVAVADTPVRIVMMSNEQTAGWTLLSSFTAGAIPTGFTVTELNFTANLLMGFASDGTTNTTVLNRDGAFAGKGVKIVGSGPKGAASTTTNLFIEDTSPQIEFRDTDLAAGAAGRRFWFHHNSGTFYLLLDRDDNGTWDAPHPWYVNSAGNMYVGQSLFVRGYNNAAMNYGTYTGDGVANRFISTGFTPWWVWIWNPYNGWYAYSGNPATSYGAYAYIQYEATANSTVPVRTTNGFTVSSNLNYSSAYTYAWFAIGPA